VSSVGHWSQMQLAPPQKPRPHVLPVAVHGHEVSQHGVSMDRISPRADKADFATDDIDHPGKPQSLKRFTNRLTASCALVGQWKRSAFKGMPCNPTQARFPIPGPCVRPEVQSQAPRAVANDNTTATSPSRFV